MRLLNGENISPIESFLSDVAIASNNIQRVTAGSECHVLASGSLLPVSQK
jgi:hypothetical protein